MLSPAEADLVEQVRVFAVLRRAAEHGEEATVEVLQLRRRLPNARIRFAAIAAAAGRRTACTAARNRSVCCCTRTSVATVSRALRNSRCVIEQSPSAAWDLS
jgi:hypothetical protein